MALLRRYGSGSAAAALALLAAFVPGLVSAQRELGEKEVKAAYLYNFAKFVDWPPEAGEPGVLRFCVFGDDPFGKTLDGLVQDEVIGDRKLVVSRPQGSQSLRDCQILFVSRSERGRLGEILSGLRGESVLTVGESDNFLDKGGIINFVLDQGKVRFEINDRAAEEAGLKISSKLLRLAKKEGGP